MVCFFFCCLPVDVCCLAFYVSFVVWCLLYVACRWVLFVVRYVFVGVLLNYVVVAVGCVVCGVCVVCW